MIPLLSSDVLVSLCIVAVLLIQLQESMASSLVGNRHDLKALSSSSISCLAFQPFAKSMTRCKLFICSPDISVINYRNQRRCFKLLGRDKHSLPPFLQPSRQLERLTTFSPIKSKSFESNHELASALSPYASSNNTDGSSKMNLLTDVGNDQSMPNLSAENLFFIMPSISLDMKMENISLVESQEPFLSGGIVTSNGVEAIHVAPTDSQSQAMMYPVESTNLYADTSRQSLTYDEVMKKTLNAILLLSCFSYAAYTIFSIDASLTRGWTQSEIAMRIPIDTWSSYESSLEDNPIYTKTLINVIIYLLGDWLSQTIFQKKNVLDFDAARTLRNGFIGLCFGPLVHEYYQFSDYILPVEGGTINRLLKIAMDQTVYLTVKCSIYIMAIGLLQGDSIDASWANVKNKIKGICFTAWKFWPLVHLITYNVIPARHRILWVNCVDLVWNAILASKTAEGMETSPVTTQDSCEASIYDDREST